MKRFANHSARPALADALRDMKRDGASVHELRLATGLRARRLYTELNTAKPRLATPAERTKP